MNFRVRPVGRLAGTVEVPGDKSISHRAALLGALANGATEVQGYLEGEDCLRTLTAIQMLGVDVTKKGPGHYRIAGVGLDGLVEPGDVIDCGNSGTTARLLIGLLAGQPFWTPATVTRASRTMAPATRRNAADEMSPGTCTSVPRSGPGWSVTRRSPRSIRAPNARSMTSE